jgi:hypothetical protein
MQRYNFILEISYNQGDRTIRIMDNVICNNTPEETDILSYIVDKKDEKKILDQPDITNARVFKGRQFGIHSPVIGYTHGDTEYFIRCLGIFIAPKKINSTSKFN